MLDQRSARQLYDELSVRHGDVANFTSFLRVTCLRHRQDGRDQAIGFYAGALGLRESHRLDFPDVSLVYMRNGENDFEIELTHNKGRTEPCTHGDDTATSP